MSFNNKFLGFKKKKSYPFRILFLISFFFNISFTVFSQEVKVSAKLDRNLVKIGDQINLNLEVKHAQDVKVQWPSIPDSFNKIEVIKKSSIDTIPSDKGIIFEKQVIQLIGFDSGIYFIPSLSFKYKKGNDNGRKVILTDSLQLIIQNIKVDTSKAIKDIKPPLDVPFSWKETIPYILGGLAIIAVAIVIYYFIKKRKKKIITEIPVKIKRPSHEIALEALKKLEDEKLWQQGNIKSYYSQLSDITRTYIENRYGINAMEHTTDEILQSLQSLVSKENKEKLNQILTLSDYVKFAKAQPISLENEISIRNAFDFVNNTKENQDNNRKEESRL